MTARTTWRWSRGAWRERQEPYELDRTTRAWLAQRVIQTERPAAPQESCDSTKPVPTPGPVRDSHSDV